MKKLYLILIICLFFIFAQPVLAHVNGKPVFKINGVFVKPAPAQSFLGKELESADIAPGKYTTDEELVFDLDTSFFPTPQDIYKKTNFIWDFGDGTQKQQIQYGVTNTHIYTNPGTYTLTIYADYTTAGFENSIPKPQLLESVSITVTKGQNKKALLLYSLLPILFVGWAYVVYIFIREKKYKK